MFHKAHLVAAVLLSIAAFCYKKNDFVWMSVTLVLGIIALINNHFVLSIGDYVLQENEIGRQQDAGDRRKFKGKKEYGDTPPVYPNGWFMICASHEVKKGGVESISALGLRLAVCRTMDGEVYLIDAYCPHLGADLGAGGIMKGKCVQCPFHGWLFDVRTGKCDSVPYSDSVPSFAEVKTYKVVEKNHCIYFWYHCDDEEPHWFIDDLPEICPQNRTPTRFTCWSI